MVGGDGVRIGLLTADAPAHPHGSPLLLVHGGMGQLERWAPIWGPLGLSRPVTAMDRRGRGSSGDGDAYSAALESADIASVIAQLHRLSGRPVDVFAHSIGASFMLGAAVGSTAVGRLILYEPPGPETVAAGWTQRITALIDGGETGRAIFEFLTTIVGMSAAQVAELRDAPARYDVFAVAEHTLPREALALESLDLSSAARVDAPTMLIRGSLSPMWARHITESLATVMPDARITGIDGVGHEAIDQSPQRVLDIVTEFLG